MIRRTAGAELTRTSADEAAGRLRRPQIPMGELHWSSAWGPATRSGARPWPVSPKSLKRSERSWSAQAPGSGLLCPQGANRPRVAPNPERKFRIDGWLGLSLKEKEQARIGVSRPGPHSGGGPLSYQRYLRGC